ncbi:MAG TPA: hypothetical protein PLX82_03455, partial [Smithellaceae bacterium]|nr:hypothetical protein [Smithellaceae bacterium]
MEMRKGLNASQSKQLTGGFQIGKQWLKYKNIKGVIMQTNAIEKIKEVFAELESSTVLEQLRAEKARKTLAEREAAAARIKAAEAELEKSLPVLQAKVEAAEAALKAHDEKRKALAEKVGQARLAVHGTKLDYNNERREGEAVLFETYDQRIDDAREYFQGILNKLNLKDLTIQKRTGEKYINEKKEQFVFSNSPAIKEAMAYCREAMRELEAMKFKPDF